MATKAERDNALYARILDGQPTFQKKDESKSRPLFGRAAATAERRSAGAAVVGDVQDSILPASRIPTRRSSQSPSVISSPMRRSGAVALTLTDAWNMAAQGEDPTVEVGENLGSPSPAPRPNTRPKIGSREDEARIAKIRAGNRRAATAPVQESQQESIDEDPATRTTGTESLLLESVVSLADVNESTTERKLTHYERYLARKEKMLKSTTPHFAMKDDGAYRTSPTRNSSGSSLRGEPVIVKSGSEWGQRAKLGTGWMKDILSPESSGELVQAPDAENLEMSVDWAGAAADVPLSSVEDETSIQEPTPPHSRPSSAQPYNASPQQSQIWDAEQDFTAKSVLYSNSPALHARGSKLDEVRQREIETLNRRALATSRLEDIRERNSAERSISPEVTRSPAKETLRRSTPSLGSLRKDSEISARRDSDVSSRRESEVSSRRDSTDRMIKSEVAKEAANEGQSGENLQPSPESLSNRSLCKDAITAALQLEPSLRRTPSPKETSEQFLLPKASKVTKAHAAASKTPSLSTVEAEIFHEKTILEEEGERIPGTPITVFYGAGKNIPAHKGDDSKEDLRKLANVLSSSPGGTSEERKTKNQTREDHSKTSTAIPLDVKRPSATSTPPKSDVDPEERIAAEASLFDLPEINKSERNSLRAPSPDDFSSDVDETPRPKADPLSMPTPVVTGAYVDSPAPTVRQPRRSVRASRSSEKMDDPRDETARLASNLATRDFVRGQRSESSLSTGVSSRPSRERGGLGPLSSHPVSSTPRGRTGGRFRPPIVNTANPASVAEDLRIIQQEAQIEDSTLDDFDALLVVESDDLDPDSTIEPAVDLENDERGQLLSERQRERRLEALAYERMNKGLKNGLLSIRDAKRGIERLEDRVSSSPDSSTVSVSKLNKLGVHSTVAFDANAVVYVAVPVPRLWVWDAKKRWGVHLTWFGITFGLLLAWLASETVACELICRPEYASVNNWHPGDPEWGMAIPTLADRLTGGFLTIVGTLLGGAMNWVWLLWTDVGDLKSARTMSGLGLRDAAEQAWKNWEGGSMFEDEAI